MKLIFIIFGLIFLNCFLCMQSPGNMIKNSSIPIKIKWVDHLSGDFSFKNNWSYPEGIYKTEFGQLSCDGIYPSEIEGMKDSTGRIYKDSLIAFYNIIDTSHLAHSIQGKAWCYEYNGADFIEVTRLSNDSVHCFTLTNISTHCSLNIDIHRNSCSASIDLNSISNSGHTIFHCIQGSIIIDKSLWSKGVMKAVFSFDFEHKENPKESMFWKGKIYSEIKKSQN